MGDWSHLPNAPITEAIIDIRVDLPSEIDTEQLLALHAHISEDYPTKKMRAAWQTSIRLDPSSPAPVAKTVGGQDGYLFTSVDGAQIVQARIGGFTFSRLHPYQTWELFVKEAHSLWDLYRKIASPEKVTRLALRYINKLPLPLPARFEDYFRTMPEIAPGLPQSLSGFLMRVQIPFENPLAHSIITQTIEADDDEHVSYVFDIDVFRSVGMSAESQEIWSILDELRNVKNTIFFKSVTDRALELCK